MLLLPFDSTYIKPIDTYEMELGLTIFFLVFVCFVSIFTLFSVYVFACLGVLSISLGMTILFGGLLREPYASHFAYSWKFQGACKTMWTTAMEMDLEGEENDGH